jgi:glycine/D-amino acid oxidase-like deaminating enzyme
MNLAALQHSDPANLEALATVLGAMIGGQCPDPFSVLAHLVKEGAIDADEIGHAAAHAHGAWLVHPHARQADLDAGLARLSEHLARLTDDWGA